MKEFSRYLQRARRFTFRHRRALAAAFVFVAVLSAIQALRPGTGGSPVVVASADLTAGQVIGEDDLSTISWPAGSRPHGTKSSVDAFVGETVATPVRAGEALTDVRILGPGLLEGYPPGAMLTTIRIADTESLTGLRPGDSVAVVATNAETASSTIISRDVHVLSVPRLEDEHRDDGASIQVVTSQEDALQLAEAAMKSRLSLATIAQGSSSTR